MSYGYTLWVAVGVAAAAVAAKWQPRSGDLPTSVRQALSLAALAGAIVGAYGLQLPADLLGWNAPPPPGVSADPLGSRTVLGGLLGGWLAVEAMKKLVGVSRPTGGDFALPLALALGFGRLGCFVAGCCAGVACDNGWFATVDAAGVARAPTQLVEAGFHFTAAAMLAVAARRRWWPTTRFPAYVACYAITRLVVEFWRQHPPVLLACTYYQLLAAALFLLAANTWRTRSSPAYRTR